MATKTIRYDFYDIEIIAPQDNKNPPTFEQLLRKVKDMTREARTTSVRGSPMRAHRVGEHQNVWTGDMLKIRMDDISLRASTKGNAREFDLDDDEGMGEPTCFLFAPKQNALVLEASRKGVTRAMFSEYFGLVTDADVHVSLQPYVHPDAMSRMKDLHVVRKFEVALARSGNISDLRKSDYGMSGLAVAVDHFDAPRVDLTLSMGHKKKGTLNSVLDAVRGLWKKEGLEIKKMRVHGKAADEEDLMIDFLEDRLKYEAVVETDPVARRVTYPARRIHALEAFRTNRRLLG